MKQKPVKVTIGELIEELSKYDPKTIVLLDDADTRWSFSDVVVYELEGFAVIASVNDYYSRYFTDLDEAKEAFKND